MRMKTRNMFGGGTLAILALLAPATLHAQAALDQGSLQVGGSASVSSAKTSGSDSRTTSLTLAPTVLYFAQHGLAVGGSLLLSHTSQDGASGTTWSIGPSAAYYFDTGDESLHPFVQGTVAFGKSTSDADVGNTSVSSTVSMTEFRADAGILKLVTGSVGITVAAFYDRVNFGDDGDGHNERIGATAGFAIFVP